MTTSITLPVPMPASDMNITAAIRERRTIREYTDQPLTPPQLSQLLWAAGGLRGDDGKRTVPSAGGEYPLTMYGAVGNVTGIADGLYRYQLENHDLEAVKAEDVRGALATAALDEQPWVANAAVILVVTADNDRMNAHFGQQPPKGQRGTRYSHIETGAAAQNVHLQATALGLGMVLVAGFDDAAVSHALRLPAHLAPTALLCLGHPA